MIGAFQIARKSFDSDIWLNKPSSWWKIWSYIIGNVQHNDFKNLKRGQGYFNFRELIRDKTIGKDITYNNVDKFLQYARQATMLATTKATHGMLISVLKYDQYQKLDSYKSDNKSERKSETEAKQKRNRSDNINKNDKNDKNVYITNGTASPEDLKQKRTELVEKLSFNPVTTQAQSEALRIAEKLGIDLNKAGNDDKTLRARWFKLFKDAYFRKQIAAIQTVYSWCYDLSTFKTIPSNQKIKLFFWKFNNHYKETYGTN